MSYLQYGQRISTLFIVYNIAWFNKLDKLNKMLITGHTLFIKKTLRIAYNTYKSLSLQFRTNTLFVLKVKDVYCYMKSFHFELKLLSLFSRVAIYFF